MSKNTNKCDQLSGRVFKLKIDHEKIKFLAVLSVLTPGRKMNYTIDMIH